MQLQGYTGIYGGSFNPIHTGHIALAHTLLERCGLEEVWFMVSPQNPLKQQADLMDDERRYELVCDALQSEAGLVPCKYEFALPRPSYMWNTLRHLSADYPDKRFALIIGADNWVVFNRWYHAADIVAHYPIIVYPRQGCEVNATLLPPRVMLVNTVLLPISSTMIRQRVAAGCDITGMVPPAIQSRVLQWYGSQQ